MPRIRRRRWRPSAMPLDQHAKVFVISHLGPARRRGQETESAVAGGRWRLRLSEAARQTRARCASAGWTGVDCAAGSAVLCENGALQQGARRQTMSSCHRRMAAFGARVFVMDAFGNRAPRRGEQPTAVAALRARWPAQAPCWWASWKRWSARAAEARPAPWWRSSAAPQGLDQACWLLEVAPREGSTS